MESDPDLVRVIVVQETISFTRLSSRRRYIFETPITAREFIHNVDRGREVQGFMLTLRREDLVKSFWLGPIIPQVVIQPDGRGAGPRGPMLRPVVS